MAPHPCSEHSFSILEKVEENSGQDPGRQVEKSNPMKFSEATALL
jgi:hypothetical protein